jgi:hypothetical protein
MKAISTVIICSALICGCSTPQGTIEQLPTDRTFEAPKNVVWPLLIQEVGLAYPVKAVEKESGLLTTDSVSMPAGYNNLNEPVVFPRVFLATWSGLRRISILVTEPVTGKTHVVIRTHWEAFENTVSHSWLVCRAMDSGEFDFKTNRRATSGKQSIILWCAFEMTCEGSAMTEEIMALGYDEATAAHYAALIRYAGLMRTGDRVRMAKGIGPAATGLFRFADRFKAPDTAICDTSIRLP